MNKKSIFVILCLFFISISQSSVKTVNANENKKIHIAVIDFEDRDISKAEASKISELIRYEIITSGNYVILERSEMEQTLKTHSFNQKTCDEVNCAVEIGKVLNVSKIIVGSVMKFGSTIVIMGRIVDIENGIYELSYKSVARNDDEIPVAVTDLVNKLMSNNTEKNDIEKPQADKEKKIPVKEKSIKQKWPSHIPTL